jgi:Zn-dependent protease with chaperone function
LNQTPHGFEASLFHPDWGSEPVGGKILVGRLQMRFHSEAVTLDIPLATLEAEFTEDGKGVYFYDPAHPEIRIFTWDQAILRQPALRSKPDVAAVVGRQEVNRALRLTAYFAMGCLLTVWLGSLAMSAMSRAIVSRIPISWEQKMGSAEIEKLQKAGKLLDDTNAVAQLTALAAPLVQALPAERRDLKFYIADDFTPNAFALPGGYVVVNAALIQMTDTPEQLLGVIAHELGHQIKRHAMRRNISSAGPFVIFGVFLHSDSGMGRLLAGGSGLMVFQGFSQAYETEADDTGWNLLVASNVDPRGMIQMFQKLDAWEKKLGMHGIVPQAFESHPTTEKRIARLEKKWDDLPRKSGFLALPPVKWNFKTNFDVQ